MARSRLLLGRNRHRNFCGMDDQTISGVLKQARDHGTDSVRSSL